MLALQLETVDYPFALIDMLCLLPVSPVQKLLGKIGKDIDFNIL